VPKTLHDLAEKAFEAKTWTCDNLLRAHSRMIVRRFCFFNFAQHSVLLGVAALLLFGGSVDGIILYRTGDATANTTAPGGSLANSGWQYEGIFGDYLGTPIAPHFFITAQHIGMNSDKLVYRGANYTIVKSFDDPGTDLRIFQVVQTFSLFAPLYTGSDEVGKHLVAIGRGTQRGIEVRAAGSLRGWAWGQSDKVQRWGENVVAAIKERPPGGEMLYSLFDKAGLPNESHLSNGDSGGGVFLNDGGVWKLGGINYDVDGAFYTGPNGVGGFLAALFDQRGFFDEDRHSVSGNTPKPSGFYASRISSRVDWIDSVVEPRLVNISTRATIGTGDQVSIAGFVVVGNPGQSRRVVVRGLGSSLKVGGVPLSGRLANPVIELHNASGALLAFNDNWRNGSQTAEIQSRGLAPDDDAEAVLVATLPVGEYSAVLRGASGSAGIGLIEVYDVGALGNARLLNLSGRAFVHTGDNVLIGGLIVRTLSQRLLLRAIGPDLTARGVTGALQNPVLELHDSNGALLSSNDSWQNAPNSSAIAATGLAPEDPRDAVILLTPGPGQFTAIVHGAGATSGVALLEAFLLE
jgi:hypothetical protein